MAEAVTRSNLFSESRNNVVAIINSAVSDPTTSSSEFRKWIYSRIPDVKDNSFKGYPFIIVHPAEVSTQREDSSGNGKKKFVSWNIIVEIYTSDRGYGVNDGKGLTHMDSISDSIMSSFLSMTNRNTLSTNNLKFSEPVSNPVETITQADELVYRREINLGFMNRIAISA